MSRRIKQKKEVTGLVTRNGSTEIEALTITFIDGENGSDTVSIGNGNETQIAVNYSVIKELAELKEEE